MKEKRTKKPKFNSYFFHLNGSTYLNKTRQKQGIRLLGFVIIFSDDYVKKSVQIYPFW